MKRSIATLFSLLPDSIRLPVPAAAVCCLALAAQAGPTTQTLRSFGQNTDGDDYVDGIHPIAPAAAPGGDFYTLLRPAGTNWNPGAWVRVRADGSLAVIRWVDPDDGLAQRINLVTDPDGPIYGISGLFGTAMVFRLTTNGAFTRLHEFDSEDPLDGGMPSSLVRGSDGNYYGTTIEGGPYNDGIVFRITTNGVFTQMAAFNDETNGFDPESLLQARDGNFYGRTRSNSGGYVFRMTPAGELSIVHTFDGGGIGTVHLIEGRDGVLYGTTESHDVYENGTLFSLTTNGVFNHLYAFAESNAEDTQVVHAGDGYLYGHRETGLGGGLLFRIATNGTGYSVFRRFLGFNGQHPKGLVVAEDGHLYGTASSGGVYGGGIFFRVLIQPLFAPPAIIGPDLQLTWSAVSGQVYQLQFKTNLTGAPWLDLGGPVTATNGTLTATDSIVDPQRFYRAVLLP